MKERKKYYLLPLEVFTTLYKIYGVGEVEIQEMPNGGSRKVASIKIGIQELFLTIEHNGSEAVCFFSKNTPRKLEFYEYKIVSLHSGFYTDGKLYAFWWIEAGDNVSSVTRITKFQNWSLGSAIEKLELYVIFHHTILQILKNEDELYEQTDVTVPRYKLPSFIPELVK